MKHKQLTLSLMALCLFFLASAQTKYKQAWKSASSSIILDAFYMNDLDVDKIKTDEKVVGLIHKATEGVNTVDPKFSERQAGAYKNHMLLGAYHLGTNADVPKQVELFLQTVNDTKNTLLVLNLQRQGEDAMNPEQAEQFVEMVYERTGKYPVIYVNDHIFQQIIKNYDGSSIFAHCLLWYERLKKELPIASLKNDIWEDYFLWEFSNGLNCSGQGKCLYNVPGAKYDVAVSVFSQDRNALPYVWNTNQLAKGLKFDVTDMMEYFPKDIYCKNKTKIENIRYVEVSNEADKSIVDRYLVYENNGRTLVSRKMFEFIGEKMDLFGRQGYSGQKTMQKVLNSMMIKREGNVFYVEYRGNPGGGTLSEAAVERDMKIMLGDMADEDVDGAMLYDIRLECD